jgi:hypothetical protein
MRAEAIDGHDATFGGADRMCGVNVINEKTSSMIEPARA